MIFSGEFVARQLAFLQQHKIMHIVNVATSEAIPNFHPDKFKYFNIEITDYEKEDIGKHFDSATKFIRNAIEKHENVNSRQYKPENFHLKKTIIIS